jgi:hypothetical protein
VTDESEALDEATIRMRLRFLRMQERTANVENREAITRKIRELEAALEEH